MAAGEPVTKMAAESSSEPPASGKGFFSTTPGIPVNECQRMIRRFLHTHPTVRFLMENLEKSGCKIPTNFIKAYNCGQRVSGGYSPGDGIVICSNHLQLEDEVSQVIMHELIHAYDDCRAKNMDWSNCAHHACSEIRAGHLSGDCHYKRELLRGHLKIRGHEQECIRRRVMMSMAANPNCSEAAAKDAMEAVWDTCYNDTKPFDRAP